MDEKIWQFEGDWYIRLDDRTSLCMNSEMAARSYLELKERLDELEVVVDIARMVVAEVYLDKVTRGYDELVDLAHALDRLGK